MKQYFKLVWLILLNISNYTHGMGLAGPVVAKQVCQKVIPAGLALLTSYLAKFQIQDDQLFTPTELQQVKACVNKPQASVLSAHIKQVTFLSPAYLEAMRIKGLNYFETNQHLSQAQIIGFRCAEFGNLTIAAGLSTIYLNLTKGDFVSARSAANLARHLSSNVNLAVTRLLAAFNNDDFNNYNICTKYELDPLWHELKLEQKLLIANNKELRRAMNLELALRHELLLKLQVELGLDHLNHTGLQAFLVGLMQLSPEQKFSVLLSLTPTHNLRVAFYKHNGLLKAFNKNPYAYHFHLPSGLSPNQISLLTKRMNELLFYNQDCTNSLLWSQATQALIAGIQGNIYYAHLAYSAISPTFMHDFTTEIKGINGFIQEQQNKPKLPYDPNHKQDELQDPNDPEHKKEVMAFLAVAQQKSDRLIEILNQKLAEKGADFQIRALNLYHTLHGDMNPGRKPTGCHSIWGRCCFVLKKVKSWGGDKFSVSDVIRNNITKPASSMFPHWQPDKIMDKLISFSQNATLSFKTEAANSPIYIIRLAQNCCNSYIDFRVNLVNKIGNIETIYPWARSIIDNKGQLFNCKCMRV